MRWKSAKIISRLISLTIWLSVDTNITDLLQREHPQILAGIGVGYSKLSISDV